MNAFFLPRILWWTAAGLAATEILLLMLAHRPIAVRAARVGGVAAAFGVLRLLLIAADYSLQAWWDTALLVALLLLAGVLLPARHIWLARVDGDEFREQIQNACRRLFLDCQEPSPGCFALTTKGVTRNLRMIRLAGRFWLVVFPRLVGRDKISLLVNWLDKQYSGSIPRLHIVLKRSDSWDRVKSK